MFTTRDVQHILLQVVKDGFNTEDAIEKELTSRVSGKYDFAKEMSIFQILEYEFLTNNLVMDKNKIVLTFKGKALLE